MLFNENLLLGNKYLNMAFIEKEKIESKEDLECYIDLGTAYASVCYIYEDMVGLIDIEKYNIKKIFKEFDIVDNPKYYDLEDEATRCIVASELIKEASKTLEKLK